MLDKNSKHVNIGDFVRYWHKRLGNDKPRPDFGEIIGFEDGYGQTIAQVKYTAPDGSFDTCLRSKSGITKLNDGEAMLLFLEKAVVYDD